MALTEFQQLVYEKTQEIPRGMVSTYKEIAAAIGRPKAVRAVGSALNKNPTPIAVPCHRVVRSDLSLGGFSKGVEMKKCLLESEGVIIVGNRVKARVYRF